MPYAIQIMEMNCPRPERYWRTVATAARISVAEATLRSVRQSREAVNTLTRIRPYTGKISRAHRIMTGG